MFDKMLKSICEDVDGVSQKEAWFEKRTDRHVAAVQANAQKIADAFPDLADDLMAQVAHHDDSKYEEPERAPYIELTWKHKNDKYDSYKTPGTISDDEINQATMHHIKGNKHHPEYWNKEDANLDPEDRDKSVESLDASKMDNVSIAEMIADWQAMSEEVGKNTAREWFEKNKDVRWSFNEDQTALIDKLLNVFEEMNEDGTWMASPQISMSQRNIDLDPDPEEEKEYFYA